MLEFQFDFLSKNFLETNFIIIKMFFLFMLIVNILVIWAHPLMKKKYFRGFELNMILIVIFTVINIILEILKKKREVEDDDYDIPSILIGIKEIRESWSFIDGIKKCGAYTNCSFLIFIFLSLFLIDQSLHLKVAYVLIVFYSYILLPVFNILINSLYRFVERADEEKNNAKDVSNKNYLQSSNQRNDSFKERIWRELFQIILNWIEAVFSLLIIHQLADYLAYSIFGWLFSVGEVSSFTV